LEITEDESATDYGLPDWGDTQDTEDEALAASGSKVDTEVTDMAMTMNMGGQTLTVYADGDPIPPEVSGQDVTIRNAPTAAATGQPFTAVLCVESDPENPTPTGDFRGIALGVLTWRQLPLPLLYQPITAPGHDGSVVVGLIETIERVVQDDGTALITCSGHLYPSDQGGPVDDFTLKIAAYGPSIGLDDLDDVILQGDSDDVQDDPDDVEGGMVDGGLLLVTQGRIMSGTCVTEPAFPQTNITLGTTQAAAKAPTDPTSDASSLSPVDGSNVPTPAAPDATDAVKGQKMAEDDPATSTPGASVTKDDGTKITVGDSVMVTIDGADPVPATVEAVDETVPDVDVTLQDGTVQKDITLDNVQPADDTSTASAVKRSAKMAAAPDTGDTPSDTPAPVDPDVPSSISKADGTSIAVGDDVLVNTDDGQTDTTTEGTVTAVDNDSNSVTATLEDGSEVTVDVENVWPNPDDEDDTPTDDANPVAVKIPPFDPGITASASKYPVRPPAAWYDDPKFTKPTPLTVTDDGQVFGHLAQWGVCHIGIGNICVEAPHETPYEGNAHPQFQVGSTVLDDGTELATGNITLAGGHADIHEGFKAAVKHYDDSKATVATVNSGEDEFGIWVAGALVPGVTDEQVAAMRSHPLSGDWRPVGLKERLVAALCVNTPGFAVMRPLVGFKNGRQTGLVAAGVVQQPRRVAKTFVSARRSQSEVDGMVASAMRRSASGDVLRRQIDRERATRAQELKAKVHGD